MDPQALTLLWVMLGWEICLGWWGMTLIQLRVGSSLFGVLWWHPQKYLCPPWLSKLRPLNKPMQLFGPEPCCRCCMLCNWWKYDSSEYTAFVSTLCWHATQLEPQRYVTYGKVRPRKLSTSSVSYFSYRYLQVPRFRFTIAPGTLP